MKPKKSVRGGLYRKKIIPEDPGLLFFFFLLWKIIIWLPVHYYQESLQPPVIFLWDSGAEKETCWRQTSVPRWADVEKPSVILPLVLAGSTVLRLAGTELGYFQDYC